MCSAFVGDEIGVLYACDCCMFGACAHSGASTGHLESSYECAKEDRRTESASFPPTLRACPSGMQFTWMTALVSPMAKPRQFGYGLNSGADAEQVEVRKNCQ